MAVLTSLFTGISGLNANAVGLSVVGDNIANMNTVGFKASRVSFADILSQTLIGGASQIGRGVMLSSVQSLFVQGSFETTSSALDLAVDGEGFFIVADAAGAVYYTRAGQFTLNKDGDIVNPEGYKLQGYAVNPDGSVSGSMGDINLSTTTSPPNATTEVDLTVNLDSREDVPTTTPFDPNDSSSYNFSTGITAYDTLGAAHLVTVYFVKTADNAWEWHVAVDDGDLDGGTPGTMTEVGTGGTLTFTDAGALDTETNGPITFDWAGGAADGDITFDFGQSLTTDGDPTGLEGTTQFASASATIFLAQDGFSSGALATLTVEPDGTITGQFTNGQSRTLAQVVLADFASEVGLTKIGRNLFAESGASGQPIVGTPQTAGRGRILSNSLELSNVDLAAEFIKLITFQRAFQANSRVITTSDEILNDLVNLKR